MANVAVAPRTPAQEQAQRECSIAIPFVEAVDNLPITIDVDKRACIVMLACGVSTRLIAQELDITPHTVLFWHRQYANEVKALKGSARTICRELLGALVADCVATGLAGMSHLHARARKGEFNPSDLQKITQSAFTLSELANRMDSQPANRPDVPSMKLTRERTEAAIKALSAT